MADSTFDEKSRWVQIFDEVLSLIAEGKIDTTPLITHRFALKDIEKAYDIFENKLDGVIKIAITNDWICAIRKGGILLFCVI